MAYYVRFSVSKITKYGTPIADCVFIVRIKLFVNLPEKSPDSEGRVSFFSLVKLFSFENLWWSTTNLYHGAN